jgi:general secretion pathway protein N
MARHTPLTHHTAQRWAWLGAGVGLVWGLVSQAPAQWLAHAVAEATQQRVLLQDAQGTLWQGSAQAVLSAGPRAGGLANDGITLPTRLTWQLGPALDWAHVRLVLRAQLASACCTTAPVQVDASPLWRGWRVQVSDHTSHWPAHWLVGLGAPWNTVQPEGQMQLQTQQLVLTQQGAQPVWQGQAELQLQQLATRLTTLRPLGTYRVQLVGSGGDALAIELSTPEGALQLQGKGELKNGHVTFQGEASAAPEAQDALSNLLNVLGQRQGHKSLLKLG